MGQVQQRWWHGRMDAVLSVVAVVVAVAAIGYIAWTLIDPKRF